MAEATAPVRWRVRQGAQLLWRLWDGEYVVFDATSGDTHLLNLVAGEALLLLKDMAADAAALTHRVASQLQLHPDAALAQHLQTFLGQLAELSLIEPDQP